MQDKKYSDSITIRCTPELKEALQKIASSKKWTLSQTAVLILEGYVNNKDEAIKL